MLDQKAGDGRSLVASACAVACARLMHVGFIVRVLVAVRGDFCDLVLLHIGRAGGRSPKKVTGQSEK